MKKTLQRILYMSCLPNETRQTELESMLETFRDSNLNNGITGIMFARGRHIIQYIEGLPVNISNLWQALLDDTRHEHIVKLLENYSTKRLFSGWSMLFERIEETYSMPQYVFQNDDNKFYELLDSFKNRGLDCANCQHNISLEMQVSDLTVESAKINNTIKLN